MLKTHRFVCDSACCVGTYDPDLSRAAGTSVGHGRPMYQVLPDIGCAPRGGDHGRCFGSDAWALGDDDYWEIETGKAVFL